MLTSLESRRNKALGCVAEYRASLAHQLRQSADRIIDGNGVPLAGRLRRAQTFLLMPAFISANRSERLPTSAGGYFEVSREVSFHDALVLFDSLQGCQANPRGRRQLHLRMVPRQDRAMQTLRMAGAP